MFGSMCHWPPPSVKKWATYNDGKNDDKKDNREKNIAKGTKDPGVDSFDQ